MKTLKGPGLFLAQFAQDTPPHNSLPAIAKWAANYGYKAIQIPSWDKRFFDLDKAYASNTYCDEVKGIVADAGLKISELSTHFQGQMVSVHPAYDPMFDGQVEPALRGDPEKRRHWAADQVKKGAKVSRQLGLDAIVGFTGSLAWPYFYPYPQRPDGLVEECFAEQGRRWKPILDEYDNHGVDYCFEIHPSEDTFDGDTFDMFLDAVGGHERACINYDASHFIKQQLDYLGFIDVYHERIKAFHVKDAEFNPTGRQGVYSGYASWVERAGRFRSLGDGQVDFGGIFSKLAQYDYASWAVLEWECCLKHPEDGAREGADFIRHHIIRVTERAFDDFAGGAADEKQVARALGLR